MVIAFPLLKIINNVMILFHTLFLTYLYQTASRPGMEISTFRLAFESHLLLDNSLPAIESTLISLSLLFKSNSFKSSSN